MFYGKVITLFLLEQTSIERWVFQYKRSGNALLEIAIKWFVLLRFNSLYLFRTINYCLSIGYININLNQQPGLTYHGGHVYIK